MGSRQVRIRRDAIFKHGNDLPGKSANIVMHNGQVFFVEVLTLSKDKIIARNFRGRKVSFPINSIDEIILDH